MTSEEYTVYKRNHKRQHAPCRRCHRINVQFPRCGNRCKDCQAESARRSRIKTGKRKVTMVGVA
jgi:DUF971 family protein